MSAPKQLTVALAATGDGTAFGCPDLEGKWVEIGGTFVATYAVKVIGASGAVIEIASVTAPAMVEVPPECSSVRVDCSAWTSGQGVAYLHALRRVQ